MSTAIDNMIAVDSTVEVQENSVRALRLRFFAAKTAAIVMSFLGSSDGVVDVIDATPVANHVVEDRYLKVDELSRSIFVNKQFTDSEGYWRGNEDSIMAEDSDFVARRVIAVDDAEDMDEVASTVFDILGELGDSHPVDGFDTPPFLVDVGLINRDEQTVGFDIVGSGSQLETGLPMAYFRFASIGDDSASETDMLRDEFYGAMGRESAKRNIPAPTSFVGRSVNSRIPYTVQQLKQLYDYKSELGIQSFDDLVKVAIEDENIKQEIFNRLQIDGHFNIEDDALFVDVSYNESTIESNGVSISDLELSDTVCALPLQQVRQEILVVDGKRRPNYLAIIGAGALAAAAVGLRRKNRLRIIKGITAPDPNLLAKLENPTTALDVDLDTRLRVFDYRKALVQGVESGQIKLNHRSRKPYVIAVTGALTIATIVSTPHILGHYLGQDAPTHTMAELDAIASPQIDTRACADDAYVIYKQSPDVANEKYVIDKSDFPEGYTPPSGK